MREIEKLHSDKRTDRNQQQLFYAVESQSCFHRFFPNFFHLSLQPQKYRKPIMFFIVFSEFFHLSLQPQKYQKPIMFSSFFPNFFIFLCNHKNTKNQWYVSMMEIDERKQLSAVLFHFFHHFPRVAGRYLSLTEKN